MEDLLSTFNDEIPDNPLPTQSHVTRFRLAQFDMVATGLDLGEQRYRWEDQFSNGFFGTYESVLLQTVVPEDLELFVEREPLRPDEWRFHGQFDRLIRTPQCDLTEEIYCREGSAADPARRTIVGIRKDCLRNLLLNLDEETRALVGTVAFSSTKGKLLTRANQVLCLQGWHAYEEQLEKVGSLQNAYHDMIGLLRTGVVK